MLWMSIPPMALQKQLWIKWSIFEGEGFHYRYKKQEEEYINERQLFFNNCSKMTAGIAFSAGNVCLSDGKIHERI